MIKAMKYLYMHFVTPVIYLQRFIHKVFFKTSNTTKITDEFYLSWLLLRDKELNLLKEEGIWLWINLAIEFPLSERNIKYSKENNILYKEYFVLDTRPVPSEMLYEILNLVKENKDKKIFINCASGVWRSAMTVIFLLIKLNICNDLDSAINFVKNKRPIIHLKHWQFKVLKNSL